MKRSILILLATLVAQAAPVAHAETTYTVVLAGGSAQNMIYIWLAPDGTNYVIDSAVPLEVGGTVCENAPDNPNELLCKAPLVAGFEVNAGTGDDKVKAASAITVPVTMRGGPGHDVLVGGSGNDKLIGGPGNDRLVGGAGDDLIYGGPGNDLIRGGPGNDVLRGGPGRNALAPGSGQDAADRMPATEAAAG
jgi:Ca2+-binding RTX toxin-like protein